MTADIINLRRARKARARRAKEQSAVENRELHGMTRQTRAARRDEQGRLKRELDGARREIVSQSGEPTQGSDTADRGGGRDSATPRVSHAPVADGLLDSEEGA